MFVYCRQHENAGLQRRCNARQVADRLRIQIRRRQMKEVHEVLEVLILIIQLALSILRLCEEVRKNEALHANTAEA